MLLCVLLLQVGQLGWITACGTGMIFVDTVTVGPAIIVVGFRGTSVVEAFFEFLDFFEGFGELFGESAIGGDEGGKGFTVRCCGFSKVC